MVSKAMHLLFKGNSEIRRRPDLGCRVSKAKSLRQCLHTDGAEKATLTEVCENSVFPCLGVQQLQHWREVPERRSTGRRGLSPTEMLPSGVPVPPWSGREHSSIPSALGRVCQNFCPATEWRSDLRPRSPYLLFPSHICFIWA